MPIQITFIGLGQIGASMGLALASHKESILRVGHDLEMEVEREALKKDAVDKTIHNLPNAVSDARLILLAIPASRVQETLHYIKLDVQPDTLILDVSPIHIETAQLVKTILPACHYVGLTPSINPELLQDCAAADISPRADLFQNAACLVSAAQGVREEAATLAVDFVRLLGAQPILSDIYEADGLATSTHLLPQLLSAALLNATVDQPGWQEARKVASRPYATLTSSSACFDDTDALYTSVMQNRQGVVHALDVMLAALGNLRDDLNDNHADGVAARLQSAGKARQRWQAERLAANWNAMPKSEPVTMSTFFERFLGTALFKKKK